MNLDQTADKITPSTGVFTVNNGATDAMTINASGALALNGSYGTSGQILQSNGNAAAPTWTTPSATSPAFSAGLTGTQSVSSGVYTKITINTKDFDTANAFDSTTNYRFTPQVAGYYQVNGAVSTNGTAASSVVPAIYKNGSVWKYGPYIQTTNPNSAVSCIVYLNGSTDYIELYAYQTATVASYGNGVNSTYFQAVLVRAA